MGEGSHEALHQICTANAPDRRVVPVDPARGALNMGVMQRTILVVDDDPHIRQLLVFALAKVGLETREAADGEAALASVAERAPDLVVLDINMPRLDGLEVCRRLRAQGDLPILFLSSRDDEIDRVLGIELGADDYVVKPFSPREVVARVQAILRRTGGKAAEAARRRPDRARPAEPGPRGLERGLERRRGVADRHRVHDPQDPGHDPDQGVQPRRHHRPAARPGFAVTDRTIDSHVRNLRAKFAGLGGHDVIETRAGIGYRLGACQGVSGAGVAG
jgi:two-component system OmpR family response regulator